MALRYAVEELLYAYVECIDEDRLEAWPDLFTERGNYQLISRENADRGLSLSLLSGDSRKMLVDRVVALRQANIYAPHFYRHLLSNIRVQGVEGGVVRVKSNYVVIQTHLDGASAIFSTGCSLDEVVAEGEQLHFRSRRIIFDTYRIKNLLATPV
ncbi:MAG: aromatic-ring-hydroxylating dioxygenase subunit beta [Gammaproteobacteria bacterium]|nr:aromatic-ring-hydroxylating dioxygenase subunit beta [Gammaproteobacteria bacterium]